MAQKRLNIAQGRFPRAGVKSRDRCLGVVERQREPPVGNSCDWRRLLPHYRWHRIAQFRQRIGQHRLKTKTKTFIVDR